MNAIGKYESFLNSKTRLLVVAEVFLAYLIIGYIAAKPLAKLGGVLEFHWLLRLLADSLGSSFSFFFPSL